eukprot:gene39153-47636_t
MYDVDDVAKPDMEKAIVYADIIIAASYYVLTLELLLFAFWKLRLIRIILQEGNPMKRLFAITMACTGVMFSMFILLCGLTHTLHSMEESYYASWQGFASLQWWTMIWCAVVSGATALAGLRAFPLLSNLLDLFQLTDEGSVRLADDIDSYKDSFMVLDSQFVVVRGNTASASLFGPRFVGSSFLEFVWDSDDVLKVRSMLEGLAASDDRNANASVEFKAYGDAELN